MSDPLCLTVTHFTSGRSQSLKAILAKPSEDDLSHDVLSTTSGEVQAQR